MKKQVTKILVSALIAALPAIAMAAEGQAWRLGLGVSWRDFDGVSIDPGAIGDSDNTLPANGPIGLQGYYNGQFPAYGGPAMRVAVDYATFNGGDEDFGDTDGFSPVLTFELPLWYPSECIEVGIVSNFQFWMLDTDVSASATSADSGPFTTRYEERTTAPGFILTSLPTIEGPGLHAGTTLTGEAELEYDLYELDLGVKASWILGSRLSVHAALGPTLNYSDIEYQASYTATWTPLLGTADPGMDTDAFEDDDSEFSVGAYAAIGAQFNLTDRLALALEGRYDWVSSSAEIEGVDVDLDSLSGLLKLIYEF